MILLSECVAACILFTLVVVAASLKDPLAQVNNWPPAIQQRARELGLIREEQMAGSKRVYAKKLATTDVYALVRNPIYSAFMFFCTGTLFIAGNIFFLPLFFFYWIFMTVLMKYTEEKWLKNLYGREYEEYCRRVNRCIPWLQRSGR